MGGFSLSSYQNFVQVFGNRRSKWLLPVPSRCLILSVSMLLMAHSCGDGINYPVRVTAELSEVINHTLDELSANRALDADSDRTALLS